MDMAAEILTISLDDVRPDGFITAKDEARWVQKIDSGRDTRKNTGKHLISSKGHHLNSQSMQG